MQNTNLVLKSGGMNSQGSKDDCYFYYYSSCMKGDDCPFRHCQAALGTETVCTLWREGVCFRDNCKFRHMESRINRGTIQCYWEDQPSGCLKPHCVFLHRRHRFNSNSGNGGLIMPVSNTSPQASPLTKVTEVKDPIKHVAQNPVESYSNNIADDDDEELNPTSHPVEPIVVSFDGEESDSESASSTPMKSASDSRYNSSSIKKDLSDDFSENNDNLGIKTLEQIKMERIHKESDNFYKSDDTMGAVIPDNSLGVLRNSTFLSDIFSFPAYDAPYIEATQIKMKTKTESSYKTECYPPQSDFLLLSDRPIEKSVCPNIESSQHSPENESGLFKTRLMKRKSTTLYSEIYLPPKKKVSLKKSKDDVPLDFKIKTLDEIRKEKQNKSENGETSVQNNSHDAALIDNSPKKLPSISSNQTESSNINGRPFQRLRINRLSDKTLLVSDISEDADNTTKNQENENQSQMILQVQNTAGDHNKTDIKGKRKESDASSEIKNVKQFKLDCGSPSSIPISSTSNELQSNSIWEERQMNKLSRPVLKRKRSTTVSLSSEPSSESKISSTFANNCESSILSPKENNTSPKEDESLPSGKNTDKKTHKTSVDELDSFLMEETDVNLDYEPEGSLNESDDILLEIEQLLDS